MDLLATTDEKLNNIKLGRKFI